MAASGTSFKPGNAAGSSTTFKPGVSNNPGGRRPAEFKQFRDFLRTYSEEAATELVDRALGRPNDAGVRDRATANDKAFELFLAYMYGRPQQQMTVTTEKSIADMTDEELLAILASGRRGAAEPADGAAEPDGLVDQGA